MKRARLCPACPDGIAFGRARRCRACVKLRHAASSRASYRRKYGTAPRPCSDCGCARVFVQPGRCRECRRLRRAAIRRPLTVESREAHRLRTKALRVAGTSAGADALMREWL